MVGGGSQIPKYFTPLSFKLLFQSANKKKWGGIYTIDKEWVIGVGSQGWGLTTKILLYSVGLSVCNRGDELLGWANTKQIGLTRKAIHFYCLSGYDFLNEEKYFFRLFCVVGVDFGC